MTSIDRFLAARDLLLRHRTDYEAAYRTFEWPELDEWNWAVDHFDRLARGNAKAALWIASAGAPDEKRSFADLAEASSRIASFLRSLGVARGDRVLVLLGNVVPLWETLLAAMKLGAVVVPASTLLSAADLEDRVTRGGIQHVVAESALAERFATIARPLTRIAVGDPVPGWQSFAAGYDAPILEVPARTRASDPLLVYFTSGTTARPKLVRHTHASYPVGHLSTLYWLGLREDDVHLNVSSPGWAKHAWSCVFAPWNAGATVFVHRYERFVARATLDAMVRAKVTTFCAPPTVWRLLVQEDLASFPVQLREVAGAGEPLNPEIIERVRRAWGLTIRDGYGQTETTAIVGNTPGQPIVPGSMGRPLPGYHVELLDPDDRPSDQGELSLVLEPRPPTGLMVGYEGAAPFGLRYRTGDVARREANRIFYVGRADDVFKSSDYRISPFELESALLEHAAVTEAAVVPSPDPIRLVVPKAFVTLRQDAVASPELARDILLSVNARLAPFQRIRRLEFTPALPKTISGKIRRVELRTAEAARTERPAGEFRPEDFQV